MNYANLNLEPGDATRYQIMITPHPEGMFVAFGFSDKIRLSGVVTHLLMDEVPSMLTDLANGKPFDEWDGRYYLMHFMGDAKSANVYNGLVAATVAWLFRRSPIDIEKRASILASAYYGRVNTLSAQLDAEFLLGRPFPNFGWNALLNSVLSFAQMNLEPDDVEVMIDDPDADADYLAECIESLRIYFGGVL